MRRNLLAAATTIALATLLVACAEGAVPATTPDSTTTTTKQSDLGGDGLPVQLPTEEYGHFPASITGELLHESNGCWAISLGGEKRVIIFPEGFTKSSDGMAMVSPSGTRFEGGAIVDATGSPTQVASLPGGSDGFWGNYMVFCDPTASEVVVVDGLEPAFDPTALSGEEQLAMLRDADLAESWGCGLGFTASSADQRVAVMLHPVDFEKAPTPPISLPSSEWEATVAIGKNLLVNNCDDVWEYWEPESVVAASWPLSAGTIRFEAPDQTGFEACGTAGPVEATLEGAVIDTPDGPLELGDLTIVNEAYGCFAG